VLAEEFVAAPATGGYGILWRLYLENVGFGPEHFEGLRVGDLLELVLLDRLAPVTS
jgi:hypothetical protein